MDTFEAIYRRRSIRSYTAQNVPMEQITQIIHAGMSAPSAGDEQPWHFVVITDRSILDTIPKVHPYANMLKEAPSAVLICGDLELEKHEGYWVQDCSAATENMLLAATALGLASVWLGVYPRQSRVEGLRKLLNLPDHVIPFALLPLGYGAEEKPAKSDFDHARIHSNTWTKM
jgi:nitroreductase